MEFFTILWLALMVVFLVTEAATVTMVSLWFAAGSLAALGIYFLNGALWLQVAVFLLVSCILLVSLWPLSKKYLTPKLTATNIDSIIGSTGYVSVTVDNIHGQGQAKLGAMEWTARSSSGEPIPEGTLVKVDKIEGVKVFVTPVKILEQV